MVGIRQYLLSVASASLICSLLKTLTDGNGTISAAVKTVCGIFLAITVFSPLVSLDFDEWNLLPEAYWEEAEAAVTSGTASAESELRGIIKERTEAYIFDKAAQLHLEITVDVTVSSSAPFVPCAVTVCGPASPYARQTLQQYIADELGISEEEQHWM